MEKRMQYKNLNHALRLFKKQVTESIPYALEELPKFDSPQEAFKYLRKLVTYKKDPQGVELFQTLPTLIENNFHGITGAGDCDCFTIAALATLIANGFTDCGIVLVGRSPLNPVHIYAYVDVNGKREYFDLTNRTYNYERPYPYRQEIPYKLNQVEKNMILQLADGPQIRSEKEVLRYLFMPSQGVAIREDYYDNLSCGQYQTALAEEGYSMDEIAELAGRWQQRRMAKKRDKLAFKKEKGQVKNEIKAAKPKNVRKAQKLNIRQDRVQGRNVSKKLRGEARVFKAQQPAYSAPIPQEPVFPEYEQPEYEQPEVEDVEYTEVDVENQTPEPGDQMAALFEGEVEVLGSGVPKIALWALGSLAVGFASGYALKAFKVRKSSRVAA